MTEAREAFEKWYSSNFIEKFVNIGAQLEKRGDQYIDFHTQDMWEVWQEKQKKIDELQKRVDAALKETLNALQYVEGGMRGNHEFIKMAMIRIFKELEQALKGGES